MLKHIVASAAVLLFVGWFGLIGYLRLNGYVGWDLAVLFSPLLLGLLAIIYFGVLEFWEYRELDVE